MPSIKKNTSKYVCIYCGKKLRKREYVIDLNYKGKRDIMLSNGNIKSISVSGGKFIPLHFKCITDFINQLIYFRDNDLKLIQLKLVAEEL